MDLKPIGLWLGMGNGPLEVVAYASDQRATKTLLIDAYLKRRESRATPVMIVVETGHGEEAKCSLAGPIGEYPLYVSDLTPLQAIAVCRAALEQPDRHSATRFLFRTLSGLGSPVPGLRNEGFLAAHELEVGVPHRSDWITASNNGAAATASRGRELIRVLGYEVEDDPNGKHSILLTSNRKIAVALYLNQDEEPELSALRYSNITPISYALAVAEKDNLEYVILTTPNSIRIYPSKPGVGVGQRGRTETYVEANLNLLSPTQAGYLWLIFSSIATKSGGTLQDILEASGRFRSALGKRLRERVYDDVIPRLSTAFAEARKISRPSQNDLDITYQMALHHLFQLLFIAYAEDKDLLPYSTNEAYRARSLKRKAEELLEAKKTGSSFSRTTRLWGEIFALCNAVDKGDHTLGIPPYNGGLFSIDPLINNEGSELTNIVLPDNTYAPILTTLLIDAADGSEGPVDFRSLGVREFGTIYEGLLESELSFAEKDLAVDSRDGSYRPAGKNDKILIKAGTCYLADTSGTRKATGSYYTKDFAVNHLLSQSLEPALTAHLKRLDAIEDPDEAGEAFFDFRIADISMGSGHFLVAAIDIIEARLSSYLASRELPTVHSELERLRESAHAALGDIPAEIEDARLLRRQIARRCIYGVDLKPAAVELARVSIWIHTFVPGLPLSLLDQHLVVGNSLTGIATVNEAERLLTSEYTVKVKNKDGKGSNIGGKTVIGRTLFSLSAKDLMRQAAEAMLTMGRLGDASTAEVKLARQEWENARVATKPWIVLLDILAAGRIDVDLRSEAAKIFEEWRLNPPAIIDSRSSRRAQELLQSLTPCHFPAVFPEVFFSRNKSGFDVIVGNPPWEETTGAEDKFWARIVPGLAGLPQREQESLKIHLRTERPDLVRKYEESQKSAETLRQLLSNGDYPGMGTGDPDLYKAFCWRFWRLLADDGYIGVVLPRSAMCVKGSSVWRKAILTEGTVCDLTFVLNKGGWVFDDAEPRYTICLTSLQKKKPQQDSPIPIRGPYTSFASYYSGIKANPQSFKLDDVFSWTDTASLPLLPNEDSIGPFSRMRKLPRLDLSYGSFRVLPSAEFHATHDKKSNGGVIEFPETPTKESWPVYTGESFDIWVPDTKSYYGWAKAKEAVERLFQKRIDSARRANSIYFGRSMKELRDRTTLPCLNPRIAFRGVTNRTNRRTLIAALIPSQVFLTNNAPYFVFEHGDEKDQAYLLGILCSIPLDWYSRRFVELYMNFYVIMPFPVPRPARSDRRWRRVVQLAGRLAATDSRFKNWAKEVGVECGPLSSYEKNEMTFELDAVVARLYELSRDDLIHIFETFHDGWNYSSRLESTLKYFDVWGEIN